MNGLLVIMNLVPSTAPDRGLMIVYVEYILEDLNTSVQNTTETLV